MPDIVQRTAEIRSLVGYIAEQQAGWFPSQFFGQRSAAFLTPVFARTTLQAQCNGVAAAGARLHDEIIGIGLTHHLFRLPEGLEQGAANTFGDVAFTKALQEVLGSPTQALARLQELATAGGATEGAMAVTGDFSDNLDELLKKLAGLYLDAFKRDIKTFPFVREA